MTGGKTGPKATTTSRREPSLSTLQFLTTLTAMWWSVPIGTIFSRRAGTSAGSRHRRW